MMNRVCRSLVLVAIAGLTLSMSPAVAQPGVGVATGAGKDAKGLNLGISRITLYRSGVGSFVRQGVVEGDATVQLRFKTDQVNDILKSMVVLDMGGGDIEGIRYASKEPLSKRLASFGVDISDNPTLPQLLGKLRGAVASVTSSEGAVSGTILGVETRKVASGNAQQAVDVPFLNLVTGSGMKSFDMTKVSSVELQDKELAGELAKALSALAEHRADRTKSVEIGLRAGGGGKGGGRGVVVGYVHEMPVWKASYRLVLPEDNNAHDKAGEDAKKKPAGFAMQGWAIVENPTDEDWNNVTLSLVSGRPVSFQMDLYEPLFVTRPFMPVPTVPGVAPRVYTAGMDRRDAPNPAPAVSAGLPAGEAGAPGGPRGGGGGGGALMKSKAGLADAARDRAPGSPEAEKFDWAGASFGEYAGVAKANAVETGEVFQYELKTPVTIPRQQSAMLPIINQGVLGRRVSIFSRNDGSEHPMRGLEVTNTTDLQLLPGPVSVFDGTAYAGDATIGHVGPGQKRLLSYAVDLDVSAIVEDKSTADIRKLRIVNGSLEQTNLAVNKVLYKFDNKSTKHDRTIILEHAKAGDGYVLRGERKAYEETPALYRFDVSVAQGKNAEVEIVQEITFSQAVAILNYDAQTMLAWQQQGKLSKAVLDAFKMAQSKQGEIGKVVGEIARLDQERNEITADQARVRENMKAIDKSTELYGTYIKQFGDQEKRIREIGDQSKGLRTKQAELEEQYRVWLMALNVE